MDVKKLIGQSFDRSFKIQDIRSVEGDDRILEFSFSSETPIDRYDYIEILDHNPESVRLQRLQTGAQVLFNHDPDIIVGVVLNPYIDIEARKCKGKVKFSRSPEGEINYQDVLDGIRRNVSISYMIYDLRQEGEVSGKPVYRITDWEPYEVSIVSIPADITVGYQRTINMEEKIMEDKLMNTNQINDNRVDERDEAKRVEEIKALGEKHRVPYEWAIRDRVPIEVFRGFVLDMKQDSKPLYTDDISLSKNEIKQYSISRAINAVINGEETFETELSREFAKRLGKVAERGKLYVPHSVFQRDLTVGGTGAGAELKNIEFLGGEFIDLLRNKMVTLQLGVRVLSGLKGDVYIPKLASGAVWGWKTETGSFSESNPATAQIQMAPKEGGTYVDYSKKLLLQSNPSVDQVVMDDLTKTAALGLDKAILKGSGASGQPRGILNTTGVNSVTSASMTYAKAIEFVQKVKEANALTDNCAFVLAPAGWAALKGRAKVSNYPDFLIDENETMVGYPVYDTAQLGNSEIIFGDFSQVLLGLWGGVELTIDPYSQATSNLIRVIVSQMADVAVRIPAAFSVGTDLS